MPTIAETLKYASSDLRNAAIANDVLDAQTLLANALGCDRTYLIVNFSQQLTDEQLAAYQALIARRAKGEPLQYITGHQEFFGLDFLVTPAVLIPRPETEFIIEEVLRLGSLEHISPIRPTNPTIVIDIGTGSGCLAVTLARELEDAHVIATDISAAALAVAKQNAERNGVTVEFLETDLLAGVAADVQANFIVSNPPYVTAAEMPNLQREVRDWEPRIALTDEADGLSFYRRLIADVPAHLTAGGYFLCELGFGQAADVIAMLSPNVWAEHYLLNDLQGIPRTLVARRL